MKFTLGETIARNSDDTEAEESSYQVGTGAVWSDNDTGTYTIETPNTQDAFNYIRAPIIGFPYEGSEVAHTLHAHVLAESNFPREGDLIDPPNFGFGGGTIGISILTQSDQQWLPFYDGGMVHESNRAPDGGPIRTSLTDAPEWYTIRIVPFYAEAMTLDECVRFSDGRPRMIQIYADQNPSPLDDFPGAWTVKIYEVVLEINMGGSGGWKVGGL